jgi:citrate synthase
MMSRNWIPRSEAIDRLGVKPQTLYAYVSRGRIAARPDPEDPRRSLYAAEDVVRLLDRSLKNGSRPAMPSGAASGRGEAVVESALTTISEGRLFYRGRDAVELSESSTLEHVARRLWGGDEDPFADLKPRVDVSFPGGPRTRAFSGLARRAEEDAPTAGRSERSLRREAAAVLNELVDAIAGGGPRLYLHQRLGRVWKLNDAQSQLIRRALVLSADAEMNETTLAVRLTASTGAALSASTLAGLAALTGPLHGGKLAQVAGYVAESRRGSDARAAARQRLAQGLEIPGFGHPLFPQGDPRAKALIQESKLPQDLADIVRVGEGLTGQAPNFDMALALVSRHLDLPKDAIFAVYAVGRSAGWLAHALEQTLTGTPIRARQRYVGVEPAFE